jgi:membrane protein DedA with SNARE-associated domain/membrane-associated phospholipid phosphatase
VLAIVAAVIVAALVVAKNQLPEFDLQKLLSDVSDRLGHWTYLLVGGAAFLETGAGVGLVAPGESVVLLGGAVAGQGAISIYLLIAITWFCCWAGDTVSFFIGRRLGRGFLMRHGSRVGITRERFERVEGYFKRHGGKTILIGRFIGLVRALAPFTAGSSGMRYRAFVPYSILGTGLWATAFCLVGYFASRSLDKAAKLIGRGTFLFACTVAVVAAIVIAARFLRLPENRRRLVAGMEGRPVLRQLVAIGRWFAPEARFLWNRVTPGGLGLELTTLLAVLSIGLFVLVAYTAVVTGDPGPTSGDQTAINVVADIRTAWLTDLAKVVTQLGAAYVTLPIAAVAAAVLASRGRWPEFWVLVAGMTIVVLVAADIKGLVDRPRPGGGLVHAGGSSFPSAHAAYSTLYVWLVFTVTTRLRPGWAGGTVLVTSGLVITATVGLTRVYLGVHYLSDVLAGWALGVAAFSLCAVVAMLAIHLRQNAQTDGSPGPGEDRA